MASFFASMPIIAVSSNDPLAGLKKLFSEPGKVIWDVWLNLDDPDAFARACVMGAIIWSAVLIPYFCYLGIKSVDQQIKADTKRAAKWKGKKGESPRSNLPANIPPEHVSRFGMRKQSKSQTRRKSTSAKRSRSKSTRASSKSRSKSKGRK